MKKNALETLLNIANNEMLILYPFKYCLVDDQKHPKKIDGNWVKPNIIDDFVDIEELINCSNLEEYAGVAISIQASDICAIDVDKCFKEPFNINTADDRASYIINLFKNKAYIEFSFSGTGLRILFKCISIENYNDKYYVKNSKTGIEYYQPSGSARYVTLTGRTIYNNRISNKINVYNELIEMLNKYMIRPKVAYNNVLCANYDDDRSIEELMKLVKSHYLKNPFFQDCWFDKAPGFGSNESERDFYLVHYIFENITQDSDKIKELFELSPFYKSKDYQHINKWKKNNFAYFYTIYRKVRGK